MQILLTIAYDGTNYAGWQRQKNAMAVQEKIEESLSNLLGRPAILTAASRTDAGVHALGQRASFFAEDLRVPLGKLPVVLNGLLPSDISIQAAEAVPDGFNPRFDAKYKTYSYNIYNAPCPNPLLGQRSAFVPQSLNLADMQKTARTFVGRHDFAAFCATGSSAKTTVREVFACDVEKQPGGMGNSGGLITLTITGNGFLYNMVRIIAGTVIYAGMGKIPPESLYQIINSADRTRAGKTMPPQGLVLVEVGYIGYNSHMTV
ncbi:MAG: tRNA pseudouridine(38-40) synthase TruA [Defluviitaleaceae bacterium]|nr:tRNA pseudouridine(38-40) synthase TruA [Defluviitaleaceae bacterium]